MKDTRPTPLRFALTGILQETVRRTIHLQKASVPVRVLSAVDIDLNVHVLRRALISRQQC